MKVLIIQDFLPIGRQETETLAAAGNQVVWVTGISDINNLVGILPDRTTTPLDTDFDVAIVDGQFYGPTGKIENIGVPVMKRLVQAGIKCIANSSQDPFNAEMVKAGAFRGINQLVLYTYLVVTKTATAEHLLQPTEQLDKFFAMGLREWAEGPGLEHRHAAEEQLMKDE